jgi:tetratricopeptide (TPR) repeat protein
MFFSDLVKHENNQYLDDSLLMSIIPSSKYTSNDLKQLNQLFIYWMMVKLIISNLNYERDVHKEHLKTLAEFSRKYYLNNTNQLKLIDEFEQNYRGHKPIWWFMTTHFIRFILNQAFQTKNIEILIKMAFFIKDLYQQFESLQMETLKTNKLPIIVYRSHHVTNEEFENIKNNKGNLLSFNNFIIADYDRETSLNLASRAQNNNNLMVGILFRIKIESKRTSTPFTSFQNDSGSSGEQKSFIFFMHSIFRIIDMKQITEQLWEIDLTLTSNNDEQVTCLTDLLRQETRETIGWLRVAQLMSIMDDFDQAKHIYNRIFELTPENDKLTRSRIYVELGNIDNEFGDYKSARILYQKSIEIQQQQASSHHLLSASYNNYGEVQRQLGDYLNALSAHKKTLKMKKQYLLQDDLSLAITYNNMALANESLGNYAYALKFHQKALSIKKKTLSYDHQEFATAFNNIGELQRLMGNFLVALKYFEKALNIRLKQYSPTDGPVAIPYNNIGRIHWELGDYSLARSFLQKSLEIKLKTYSSDHPWLCCTYNNIGDVDQQMGEYSDALSYYQKALEIQEKAFSSNHPEIALTYTNIGKTQRSLGNYSTSLSYYRKAV